MNIDLECDVYTQETYRQLLIALKEREYCFADFEEMFPSSYPGKVVYLRHDIDYSPVWALDFARINASQGVAGIFFFQLRSPIYNLLSYPILAIVKEIVRLGQRVGLHYTIAAENSTDDEALVAHITADYQNTLHHIKELSPVFSWHNPSLAPDILRRGLDMNIPGMVSTYSRYFIEEVKYAADSNLRYSVEEFENIISNDYPRLQLLFHPFQWMAGGNDMQQVLANTWMQVIREKEVEFLNNHVYRELFPSGMPGNWLAQLSATIGSYRK